MNDPQLFAMAERVYAEWRAAMTTGDTSWVIDTEHEQFRYTGSEGQRKGKPDHVKQVTSGRDAEFRTKILTVDRYGDIVIVTGDHWARATVDADRAGLPASIAAKMGAGIDYAFTSVWQVSVPRWILLAHHTSEHAAGV